MGHLRRILGNEAPPPHPLLTITDDDRRYVTSLYDETVPLPPEATGLGPDHPELVELRRAYGSLELPVIERSRWNTDAVGSFLDLRWFRGETLFLWHYRELPRISELKYFVYGRYVQDHDDLKLLQRLSEDGLFGCWTFDYPEWMRVSRDLLQSVNEINFLERRLAVSSASQFRVLDIGAGYGRLAHRMTSALPNVADYCCVDVVPEATFISDWYLRFRGCSPPARVVRLDEIEAQLPGGTFDLAVNMHSFSECPHDAIEWWVDWLRRLEVPNLLLIPNEPDMLLTTEADGTRRDFAPLLAGAGYTLVCDEPVITDPAVRALLPLSDHFRLYSRR